jgi:hypothetical protein
MVLCGMADGGWVRYVGGEGRAHQVSGRGRVVCDVGGAGVVEVEFACGEGRSGVGCQDVVLAPRTRRGALVRGAAYVDFWHHGTERQHMILVS